MQDMIKISLKENSNVVLKAIPGHFITPNSHVNYYLDMTTIKSRLSEASAAAKELATKIKPDTIVDTIVCMDGCEIIGAYLAEELTKAGVISINYHKTIYITTPEIASTGQLVFRDNIQPMIKGKNVLLLIASATTGQTLAKAIQALNYYGATISGISAIFSAANSSMGIQIKSLFTIKDIPDYKAYAPEGCSMCKDKKAIDAFANAYGYSSL